MITAYSRSQLAIIERNVHRAERTEKRRKIFRWIGRGFLILSLVVGFIVFLAIGHMFWPTM